MNSKIIKVLLVEDNAGDARLIQEALMESEATLFSLPTSSDLVMR